MKINTALILCAGFGKRLNPITLNTPKPLLEIKDVSMLERCINLIEKLSNINSNYKILKQNRIGDHLWWITDNSKFKKDYPNWKIKISLIKNLEEMVSFEVNK